MGPLTLRWPAADAIGAGAPMTPPTRAPRRRARWSDGMTRSVAALVRPGWRPAVLGVIRAIHTAVFASMSLALGILVWDGVRQRPAGRTLAAGTLILAESAVYLSNDQVCPFTPLAEQIGAERGAVVDLYLPGWLARRIPMIGGAAMVLGLALNLRAWQRRKGAAHTLVG